MGATREFLRRARRHIAKAYHIRKTKTNTKGGTVEESSSRPTLSPLCFQNAPAPSTPVRQVLQPKTRHSSTQTPNRVYKCSAAMPLFPSPSTRSPVGSRVKQLRTPIRTRESVYDLKAIQRASRAAQKGKMRSGASSKSRHHSTPKTPLVQIDSAVRKYMLAMSVSSELHRGFLE